METRYYSDTDTTLALHASKKVFDRITGHLERKSKLKEEIDKITKHRQYLRDETMAMTADWDNSIQNIRLRKEEARQQRLAQKADDRVEQYFKIKKLQAEDRKKYNEEVARRIFLTRNPQKDLNTKIALAECVHINNKQIKLKDKQKTIDDNDWKNYEQQIIEQDAKFKNDELKKKCEDRVKAEKIVKFQREQVAEKKLYEENEKRMRIDEEIIEIEEQKKEMEHIKQLENDKFLTSKQRSIQSLKDAREIAKKIHEAKEKTAFQMETACHVYEQMKKKRDCTMRKLRKENLQEVLRSQERASQRLRDLQAQKCDNEDEIIAMVQAERDEKEALKQQMRKEHEDKLRLEKKQIRENNIEEAKIKAEKEKELEKWEMLNRMKILEIIKMDDDKAEEVRRSKLDQYSKLIHDQMEENKVIAAEKKAIEDSFKWNNYPEVDMNFLNYGAEMLTKQKESGKPTYPIEAGIAEYKRRYGLIQNDLNDSSENSGEKRTIKRMKNSRRICPEKNDSSGVKNCFCT